MDTLCHMEIGAFRALREGAAAYAAPEHAVARVRGDDPLAFLHAMTTQDVEYLAPGAGALACLLDEKGHVLAELRILSLLGGDALVDAEPEARAALIEGLARVAPLSGCEVIDESGAWAVTHVRGPRALTDLDDLTLAREHAHAERRGTIVVRVDWGPAGFDVLTRGEGVAELPAIGFEEFEAARIDAGRPRFGVDVTPELIVNETPLLAHAVSFTKGCYPGQETVAKIRNLGRARRALVGLRSGKPLAAGDAVSDGAHDAGRITSAAETPEGWAAIALVRAEAADAPALRANGAEAAVRALR